nr:hypothetical protein Iba_chr03fCG3450 [Ipomoea batatas]
MGKLVFIRNIKVNKHKVAKILLNLEDGMAWRVENNSHPPVRRKQR